jgi:NitT/TauT family transport system substrate-binding protein
MRITTSLTLALIGAVLASGVTGASAEEKIKFGTNWKAEAEHGGFYQAVADGTYKACGLDVTIVPGGPQVNNGILLPTGKVDFLMGSNLLDTFNFAAQKIPVKVVAAIFQKEAQVLLSHPGVYKTFDDLKSATLFLSAGGVETYYQWMITEHGFKKEQTRPYTFNPAPFIADPKSVQQAYITSEPYAVEKQGGFKPDIWVLGDLGFNTYATTIETMDDTIAKKPAVVQCFVDGSIKGWYNYLYGDNKAANAMIKKDNPEMDDDQIAFSVAQMKAYGIVDSGDTLKLGIGAIKPEHMTSFYDKMVKAKVIKPDFDVATTYTTAFVNKGVGLDLKK